MRTNAPRRPRRGPIPSPMKRPIASPLLRPLLAGLAFLLAAGTVRAAADQPPSGRVARPPTAGDWARLAPHPRLFAPEESFERIRKADDEVSRRLLLAVRRIADEALAAEPVRYPETGIMVPAARAGQGRIVSLAFLYRLTGDRRCLERARAELRHLATLPHWGPSHFLAVGEAALAAGIGLDWLHAELSAEERTLLGRAIVEKALRPSLEVPTGGDSWVDGNFNWAQVCHAGLVVGALAVADEEPALARRIVARAVGSLDPVGATYAPDGSYAEGPSYWSYGTTFHVLLIEALRGALGTSAGLERYPGFLASAGYKAQMLAPSGDEYNYSDHHVENVNEPVLLWYARELRDRHVARDEFANLARLEQAIRASAGTAPAPRVVLNRFLPFGLLWWDPALPAGPERPPLHWTAGGTQPLAVIRSAWDDPAAAYLAVKGGTPNHSHGHMDVGSFVWEVDGVRWALDLGTESYGRLRAAGIDLWNYRQDSSRWTVFRVGPDGHNILRFDGARQQVDGFATIRPLPASAGAPGNEVDLTPLYRDQVADVRRVVRLGPDRSLHLEDTWTASDRAVTASWQWLTRARVLRRPDGLRLEQDGRALTLRIEAPAPATGLSVEVEDVAAPRGAQDSPNPGLSRIVVTVVTPARATQSLRVVAAPAPP